MSLTLAPLPLTPTSDPDQVSDVLQLEEPSWLRPAAARAMRHAMSGGEALSIAGGPGFDLAALALLVSFKRLEEGPGSDLARLGAGTLNGAVEDADGAIGATGGQVVDGALDAAAGEAAAGEAVPGALHVRVLDYEAGWATQVGAMEGALRRRFSSTPLRCSCGLCDITRPLAHASNAELRAALPRARLLVASYCVAENANSLRESGFVFFEDVVRAAAPGTLLLVLETTHRQFPALVAAARKGAGAEGLEIACPFVLSNSGFSLCLLKGGEVVRELAAAPGAAGTASREGLAEAGVEQEAAAAARLEATQEQQAALEELFARFDRDELVHAQKGYNRARAMNL